MQGVKAKIDYILKHNAVINKTFKAVMSTALRIWGFFLPVDDNTVIFSGHGRKYNDSPKAIYEYMINQPEYQRLHYIWALDDPEHTEIPGKCIKIKADTLTYFKETLKCKYWVTCVNIERGLRYKKKKTVYLNTWHGSPIKTIGNAAMGRKDYDFSNIDFFCSAGQYEKDIYIRDFQLRPESIINTGLPRNDELYHVTENEVEKLRADFGIPKNKKVILYAPTWRDSLDQGKTYSIKPPINTELWEEKLGQDYILLFRTHPYTNKLLGVQFNDFIKDCTNYPRINDLLKVSDILISDYSATIFDYSILEKPMICFGYDYDSYAKERGLYLDLEKILPGGVMKTENEVINRILDCNWDEECEMTRNFKQKYLEYGGDATRICVDTLFSKA